MQHNSSNNYTPMNLGINNDEESVSFIPTGVLASSASSNSNNNHLMYSIDGTDDTTTAFTSNENLSTTRSINFQTQNQQGQLGNEVIAVAVAVPNTIRPPQLQTNVHPSVAFAKKLAILLCGLFLTILSFFDAWLFFELKYWHKVSFTLAAVFWGISTICLLVGSFVGAYQGKWRYLAPGIVMSHIASFIIGLIL
mmetsp:Transcript_4877/g.7402  ORF Transcript_4877/g.7402 Transcript_4877/m.7402 type:complete len:195 (+) Transcript_4877:136-720(+)